jgi:hypothetical protein
MGSLDTRGLYHRTWEVGDGVGDGDGERSVDALAAHGYVLTEEALRDLERPARKGGGDWEGEGQAVSTPSRGRPVSGGRRGSGKPQRRVKLGWRTA